MTAFASKVLSQLPDTTSAGNTNNYTILQQFTNHTDKAGGKVDMRLSDRATVFGRFGWRDLNTVDDAPVPLPAGGGGNGTIYAQNKQLALGSTYVLGNASLSRSAVRLVADESGQESSGTGFDERASTSTASAAFQATRASRAACRRRASRATQPSAASRPIRSGSTRPCSIRR